MATVTRVGSVVATLALAAACSPDHGPRYQAAGATTPVSGGTLHLAFKDGVVSLDPIIGGGDETSSTVVHMLFDTLVDFKSDSLEIEPRLADYDISTDGLTYTFTLHDGIKYSDGTDIQADDFKFALERALANHDCGSRETLRSVVGAQEILADKATLAAGIVVKDPRTLELHLVARNPALLDIMTMSFTAPMRRDWVDSVGSEIRRRPLATGPYMLERWDEGRRIMLVRNPNHRDPRRGRIEHIEILERVDRTAQFLMFENRDLDAVDRMSPPDWLWLAEREAWKPYIHRVPLMNAYGSRFDVRTKPFDDKRVRQAFNYAINKDHTTKLLVGTSVPAHGILPPRMLGNDVGIEPYPHDPAKAKKLLADAGYSHELDIDYLAVADDEARRIAASLQSDLAEVGVHLHVISLDATAYYDALTRPENTFTQAGWTADYPDPTDFIDLLFSTHSIETGTNNTHYSNPELDRILAAAAGEDNADARADLYHRAERILYDDPPWIWNYHQQLVEVTQPYVRGYAPHPVWQRDYSYAWLDLGPDGAPVKAP